MATIEKQMRDAETDNWAGLGWAAKATGAGKRKRQEHQKIVYWPLFSQEIYRLPITSRGTFCDSVLRQGDITQGMSYASRVTQSDVGAGQRLASFQSVKRGSGAGFKHQRPRGIDHQRAKGNGQILATPSE